MVQTNEASVVCKSSRTGQRILIIGAGAMALALLVGSHGFVRSEDVNPPALRSREFTVEDIREGIDVDVYAECDTLDYDGTPLEEVDLHLLASQARMSQNPQGRGPCQDMDNLAEQPQLM